MPQTEISSQYLQSEKEVYRRLDHHDDIVYLRRLIGTFYLLAQKLVSCKLRSRQIDHRSGQGATKAMGDLSGVISVVLKQIHASVMHTRERGPRERSEREVRP